MFSGFKSWLIIVVLVIAGPVVFVGGLSSGRDFKALQAEGMEATALIQSIQWKEKRGSSRSFKADVEFKTQEGKDVSAKLSIPSDMGQKLKSDGGSPMVKLRYLPSNPNKVQLLDAKDDSGELMGLGGGMLLLGLGLGWWRLRRRSEEPTEAVTA